MLRNAESVIKTVKNLPAQELNLLWISNQLFEHVPDQLILI